MHSAKKRLLVAITLAEPGGATSLALRLAEWLQNRGHDVTVVAGDGAWLFRECQIRNIPTIRLKHCGRAISPLRDVRALVELRRVFRALKPDAVHLNSTKMGILGSIAAHFSGVPRTVYRIGGWVFLEPLPRWRRYAYLWLERLTAAYKDAIICVHPQDQASAIEQGIRPREPICIIPNGIDLDAFERQLLPRNSARAALRLPAADFIFGTIAHLYPAKNLAQYLEACLRVHAQHPETRFVIIGAGPERERIEQTITRLHLEDAVFLAGHIEQAGRYLPAFDAFVLPSAKEGMPWSLLEAMAAGLPCIATDVGANAWLFEQDAGWIVPPNQSELLAEAMLAAMHQPSLAKIRGQRAHERAKRCFPLERTLHDNAMILLG